MGKNEDLWFFYAQTIKCLSNRLKEHTDTLTQVDQTYCVPGRIIMDNVFLVHDMKELCKINSYDLGFLSLDQEKAFEWTIHIFLIHSMPLALVHVFFIMG